MGYLFTRNFVDKLAAKHSAATLRSSGRTLHADCGESNGDVTRATAPTSCRVILSARTEK
jgi:hypothetical protein